MSLNNFVEYRAGVLDRLSVDYTAEDLRNFERWRLKVLEGLSAIYEGDTMKEKIIEAVADWLDDHPEATTTVEDGAVTTAKLYDEAVTTGKVADGAITDAKLASDGIKAEVADLKSDLNSVKDGERVYTKAEVLNFELISTSTLYSAQNVVIGTTTLSQLTTSGAGAGIQAIKVPLDGVKKISYPVAKTTGYWSSFIFDEDNVVLWYYYEAIANTGTIKTVDVPQNASYMLLYINGDLYTTLDWNVTLYYRASLEDVETIEDGYGEVYEAYANLLDRNKLTPNSYLSTANGKVYISSTYTLADYIPIQSGCAVLCGIGLQNYDRHACWYDKDKNFIANATSTTLEYSPYRGVNYGFVKMVAPSGAKFLRFDANNALFNAENKLAVFDGYYEQAFKPYKAPTRVLLDNLDSRLQSALAEAVGKPFDNSWSGSYLIPTYVFKLGVESSVKGEERLYFFSHITTMGEIKIGLKGNTYCLHIDGTDYWFSNNGTESSKYAHNITFKDYIAIELYLEGDGAKAHIRVSTNGQTKVLANNTFTGTTGRPTITSVSYTGAYSRASYMCKTSRPIWIFGDSYITSYSTARWSYYLYDWGLDGNVLMNGYAGQTAQTAIKDFENLLTFGNPRYAVWCLGMNNGDDGEINSDWLTATQKFIALCEANNIVPILATIPNVPSVTHTYKNAWIKASGYRYVDFASAVNAESQGATWFDGMLAPSPDLVHPTAQGALCLANEFVMSVPEVTYK